MSMAMEVTSRIRCSAKVSTTTATTRFKIPKTIVRCEPTNIPVASQGWCSIRGTATSPQLSPATTVLKISRLAKKTDCNDFAQNSQSCQIPRSTMSGISGFSNSTASIAQEVMITKQNRKDQHSVLKQRPVILRSFRSSFSIRNLRNKRKSRMMRTTLSTRSRVNWSTDMPAASRIICATPDATIRRSRRNPMSCRTRRPRKTVNAVISAE
mmetsp:Transcript_91490/g.218064  ORF Transcript_91490/g.218064 Transcript_91490/m.218064 type:complete len:211 (-) Transcript_91490:431-1063(-)